MADLCALADVRLFLRKTDADVADDPILSALITAASDEISRYTSREFTLSSGTRRFRVTPARDSSMGPSVDLIGADLYSVTEIILGPEDASPTTLDPSAYSLGGQPGVLGTYSRVLLARNQSVTGTETWSTFGFSEVDISGNWGAVSIPPIVAQACVVTVADWYRQKVTAFSRTFDESGIYTKPAPLPDAVCGWLQPFERYVAA